MEELRLIPIKSDLLRIQHVCQVTFFDLIFAHVSPIRVVCKTKWMVVVIPFFLDKYISPADFHSNYRIGVVLTTFFKVKSAKVRCV
jgi:hypothetical protein